MKEGYIIIKLKVKVDNSELLLTTTLEVLKKYLKSIIGQISKHIGITIECVLVDEDK